MLISSANNDKWYTFLVVLFVLCVGCFTLVVELRLEKAMKKKEKKRKVVFCWVCKRTVHIKQTVTVVT
jgi:prepilin signal peptidase PulO-like enzyme (type II secretory pathway)